MLTLHEQSTSHYERSKVPHFAPDLPPGLCILSPCHFAARGLTALLRSKNVSVEPVWVVISDDISAGDEDALTRGVPEGTPLVVYIPDVPLAALRMLKQVALLLGRNNGRSDCVFILSHFSPAWLYRTLLHLSGMKTLPVGVMATRADLTCHHLTLFISRDGNRLPLKDLAAAEERSAGHRMRGLTRCELEVVMDYLDGRTAKSRTETSPKTQSIQRNSGLRKLVGQLPSMSEHLPGRFRIPPTSKASRRPDEAGLIRAIHDGHVYPVFQPVVDRDMHVKGFEVLTRWLDRGQVVQPAEFLPLIRSRETWLLLTSFVMNEAVQCINQFGGTMYFTVNIPPCIAESSVLISMVETACRRLKDRSWGDCLVPEFSETTVLGSNGPALDTLRQMMAAGYRIFLDDCYSEGSVMFPVRLEQFSGYKLDMSIVKTFRKNRHDKNLIRGLAYYCKLAGSQCIAEGVDSEEKFSELVELGVDSFQGFYISPPVAAGDLEKTVRRLGRA